MHIHSDGPPRGSPPNRYSRCRWLHWPVHRRSSNRPPPMPGSVVRVVDVYPYRESAVNPEFLLLRRAPGTEYAGQWRMVGGKIESGEAAWETAHREVTEETGHAPDRLWTLPSVNAFYEWQDDRINLIPAFAAALPGRGGRRPTGVARAAAPPSPGRPDAPRRHPAATGRTDAPRMIGPPPRRPSPRCVMRPLPDHGPRMPRERVGQPPFGIGK